MEDKEIDALDKTHISEDSLIAMEIKNTGVELYAKWNYHKENDLIPLENFYKTKRELLSQFSLIL